MIHLERSNDSGSFRFAYEVAVNSVSLYNEMVEEDVIF